MCSFVCLFVCPRTSSDLLGPPRTSSDLLGPPRTSSDLLGPLRTSSDLLGPPRTSSHLLGSPRTSKTTSKTRTSRTIRIIRSTRTTRTWTTRTNVWAQARPAGKASKLAGPMFCFIIIITTQESFIRYCLKRGLVYEHTNHTQTLRMAVHILKHTMSSEQAPEIQFAASLDFTTCIINIRCSRMCSILPTAIVIVTLVPPRLRIRCSRRCSIFPTAIVLVTLAFPMLRIHEGHGIL